MSSINSVLVANRGEIALRVMKTCRRMGLGTVAVFTDVDADAPHVKFADSAVRLGEPTAYLDTTAILRACRVSGADAVHPGYGFLSENPDFAQAVLDAGLVFIGPPPAAIRAMGLKREAKALVGARGVPLVPGSDGGDQSLASLKAAALKVGLPVIFKPSAGGGGKGMKIARAESELESAITSGQREATNAFGNPTLIIERYLERPRHLEIQLLGDHHGNVVHLFERECSIQRRHQKVVEETPSPVMTLALREKMGAAAVEVAKAIRYTNAGTVEFIMDEKGAFYFSEMNTRLQVEHRVTEQVVGLDLVEHQIRIARGERLRFVQSDICQQGHAVQVRLYAEDPASGFLPAIGPVLDFHFPELGGVLVDAGVASGGAVSPQYDPMVAKLVAHAETREQSAALMRRALERLSVLGLKTNQRFLHTLLGHPDYLAGKLHTGFIAQHFGERPVAAANEHGHSLAAVAVVLHGVWTRGQTSIGPRVPLGWRNNHFADAFVDVSVAGVTRRVNYRHVGDWVFAIRLGESESRSWRIIRVDAPAFLLEDPDGVVHQLRVAVSPDGVFVATSFGPFEVVVQPRYPLPVDEVVKGGTMAPMPGKVVKVLVREGDAVKQGQALLVLEAMKMEQTTSSPLTGTVKRLLVKEGDQVKVGQSLVVVE